MQQCSDIYWDGIFVDQWHNLYFDQSRHCPVPVIIHQKELTKFLIITKNWSISIQPTVADILFVSLKTYLKEVLEWLIRIGMKLSNILCEVRNRYRLGVHNLAIGYRDSHFLSANNIIDRWWSRLRMLSWSFNRRLLSSLLFYVSVATAIFTPREHAHQGSSLSSVGIY